MFVLLVVFGLILGNTGYATGEQRVVTSVTKTSANKHVAYCLNLDRAYPKSTTEFYSRGNKGTWKVGRKRVVSTVLLYAKGQATSIGHLILDPTRTATWSTGIVSELAYQPRTVKAIMGDYDIEAIARDYSNKANLSRYAFGYELKQHDLWWRTPARLRDEIERRAMHGSTVERWTGGMLGTKVGKGYYLVQSISDFLLKNVDSSITMSQRYCTVSLMDNSSLRVRCEVVLRNMPSKELLTEYRVGVVERVRKIGLGRSYVVSDDSVSGEVKVHFFAGPDGEELIDVVHERVNFEYRPQRNLNDESHVSINIRYPRPIAWNLELRPMPGVTHTHSLVARQPSTGMEVVIGEMIRDAAGAVSVELDDSKYATVASHHPTRFVLTANVGDNIVANKMLREIYWPLVTRMRQLPGQRDSTLIAIDGDFEQASENLLAVSEVSTVAIIDTIAAANGYGVSLERYDTQVVKTILAGIEETSVLSSVPVDQQSIVLVSGHHAVAPGGELETLLKTLLRNEDLKDKHIILFACGVEASLDRNRELLRAHENRPRSIAFFSESVDAKVLGALLVKVKMLLRDGQVAQSSRDLIEMAIGSLREEAERAITGGNSNAFRNTYKIRAREFLAVADRLLGNLLFQVDSAWSRPKIVLPT